MAKSFLTSLTKATAKQMLESSPFASLFYSEDAIAKLFDKKFETRSTCELCDQDDHAMECLILDDELNAKLICGECNAHL